MTSAVITLYRDLPDEDVDRLLALLDEAGIDAEVARQISAWAHCWKPPPRCSYRLHWRA